MPEVLAIFFTIRRFSLADPYCVESQFLRPLEAEPFFFFEEFFVFAVRKIGVEKYMAYVWIVCMYDLSENIYSQFIDIVLRYAIFCKDSVDVISEACFSVRKVLNERIDFFHRFHEPFNSSILDPTRSESGWRRCGCPLRILDGYRLGLPISSDNRLYERLDGSEILIGELILANLGKYIVKEDGSLFIGTVVLLDVVDYSVEIPTDKSGIA